jgi:hypothetical protein
VELYPRRDPSPHFRPPPILDTRSSAWYSFRFVPRNEYRLRDCSGRRPLCVPRTGIGRWELAPGLRHAFRAARDAFVSRRAADNFRHRSCAEHSSWIRIIRGGQALAHPLLLVPAQKENAAGSLPDACSFVISSSLAHAIRAGAGKSPLSPFVPLPGSPQPAIRSLHLTSSPESPQKENAAGVLPGCILYWRFPLFPIGTGPRSEGRRCLPLCVGRDLRKLPSDWCNLPRHPSSRKKSIRPASYRTEALFSNSSPPSPREGGRGDGFSTLQPTSCSPPRFPPRPSLGPSLHRRWPRRSAS